jgi:hypothetical protein
MFRFRTRVASLVAAVSVTTLGLAAPAQAGSAGGSCQAGTRPFWMNVAAFYVDELGGTVHRWTHLSGALNGSAGDHSNVNAWFYQHSQGVDVLRREFKSEDNVRGGDFMLPVEPNATTHGPAPEFVVFEAIFDKFGPDPRCNRRSETV